MFKKTDPNPQLDMFTSPVMHLNKRASKKYTDEKSWHNQFFRLVTCKIEEDLFSPLFPEGKKSGRPNASIRILVAMSILKEGFGCSDEDMFEKCEFDLLTRKALGLELISDSAPSLDTWYLFHRRIFEYERQSGVNLLEKCFEQVTGEQVRLLKISGKSVRMDSKLIGSNIAKTSRYELVHRTLVKFLKSQSDLSLIPSEYRGMAEDYIRENSSKTVYRSDKDELQCHILTVGEYVRFILDLYPPASPDYEMLKRMFDEQFVVTDGKVALRNKAEIPSGSLQSPHDPDAAYRNKNGKEVSGYVTNITETIEDDKPSVIVSVQVESANHADCHFLQQAVENSERVTGQTIEEAYADGAYQSPENREFSESHGKMQLKTGRMQGGNRWLLTPHDADGLTVVDTRTGLTYEAVKAVTKQGKFNRWRIPWNNKTGWRYFEEKEIQAHMLRKQIESLPPEEQHKRNNVEAAMFQYSFHTRNGKTRYRGLFAHKLHAYHRCMWMNLRRIWKFQVTTFQRPISALFRLLREMSWPFLQGKFHIQIMAGHLSESLRIF